jgi:tight adherence protein B
MKKTLTAREHGRVAAQTLASLDKVILLLRSGVPAHRILSLVAGDATELPDPNARAVFAVAVATGAPLTSTVSRLQSLVRGVAAAHDEIVSALAAPLLARRIVMLVPVASIALGSALGFNVLEALFSSPLGVACLVGGAVLSILGWVWMRKLVARATDHHAAPGLWCELVAVAMGSGLPLGRAVRVAESALHGVAQSTPEEAREQGVRLLTVAAQAGVSVSAALHNLADDQRARSFADQRRAARELGERILVPMGACFLPAFLLWGVVPIVGSVVSDTLVVA